MYRPTRQMIEADIKQQVYEICLGTDQGSGFRAQGAVSVGGDRQKGLFSGTRKDVCVFVSTRAGVFEREK
jgi:hypothetical protein